LKSLGRSVSQKKRVPIISSLGEKGGVNPRGGGNQDWSRTVSVGGKGAGITGSRLGKGKRIRKKYAGEGVTNGRETFGLTRVQREGGVTSFRKVHSFEWLTNNIRKRPGMEKEAVHTGRCVALPG